MEKLNNVVCPYDKNHIIHKDRFVRHILKCAKRFPAEYKETCPFNARHIMSRAELEEHIEVCPDKRAFIPESESTAKLMPRQFDDISFSDFDDESSMTGSGIPRRPSCSGNTIYQGKSLRRSDMFKSTPGSINGSDYNESDTESLLLPFGRGSGSCLATPSKFPAFGRGSGGFGSANK